MSNPLDQGSGWLLLARVVAGVLVFFGVLTALDRVFGGGVLSGLVGAVQTVHLSFSLILWPFALLASAWAQGLSSGWGRLSRFALFLGVVAVVLALAVPLIGGGASFASALPVLRHPLHGAALGLFLLSGLLVAVARLATCFDTSVRRPDALLWYPIVPVAVMAFSAGWAWDATGGLDGGMRVSYALWGPAYLLSFFSPALLMLGWIWLLEGGGEPQRRLRVWQHGAFCLAVLPSTLVVLLQLQMDIADPDYFFVFERLVVWLAWPGGLLLAMALFPAVRRKWCAGGIHDVAAAIASAILFFLGAATALMPEEFGDTFALRSHLSGGALLIVFAVLAKRWGGAKGFSIESVGARTLGWGSFGLIGGGILVAAGVAQAGFSAVLGIASEGWPKVAALVMVVGGVFALVGLWPEGGTRFLPHRLGRAARPRGAIAWGWAAVDLRVRAVIGTVLAIAVIGGVIAMLPPVGDEISPSATSGTLGDRHEHVVSKRREEVQVRFDQGVVMLNARRYDDAATAFHRVLQLAPEMPEAHVNMGYAMLGKQEYKLALDFFEGATNLRTQQLNAYYGLALAYEGMGNFEAASGAMRTYQHLTGPDDPYLPKVMAKLREYQEKRVAAPPVGNN